MFQIFHKIQSTFTSSVSDPAAFWDEFDAQVAEFKEAVNGVDKKEVLAMVSEPKSKTAPEIAV